MNYSTVLLLSSLVLNSSPREPWDAGLVHVDKTERMSRLKNDIANADLLVEVTGDDQLDIGISPAKTFAPNELQDYFKRQRHKDFIVVSYDKNSGNRDLGGSFARLKVFLLDAGYKRILFTHANPSGVMILGDFRTEQSGQKKVPTIEFEISPEDGSEPVTLGPTASQQFRETIKGNFTSSDPKDFTKSLRYGVFFVEGEDTYEFHNGLIVHRTKDEVKIWKCKMSDDLTRAVMGQRENWKALLRK